MRLSLKQERRYRLTRFYGLQSPTDTITPALGEPESNIRLKVSHNVLCELAFHLRQDMLALYAYIYRERFVGGPTGLHFP